MYNVGDRVRLRDGRTATVERDTGVLGYDLRGHLLNGREVSWQRNGRCYGDHIDSKFDIVETLSALPTDADIDDDLGELFFKGLVIGVLLGSAMWAGIAYLAHWVLQ